MFTSRLAICKYKSMISKLIMHGWIVLGHTLILTDLSQVSLKGIPLRFTTFSTALSVVRPAAILYPNIYSSQFNNHPQIHVKISFKKHWYLDTIFPVGKSSHVQVFYHVYSLINIHSSAQSPFRKPPSKTPKWRSTVCQPARPSVQLGTEVFSRKVELRFGMRFPTEVTKCHSLEL